MKNLLDKNLPKRLKKGISDHEIFTVSDQKWNGSQNGELLNLMLAANFDRLFTFDQNIKHQQNFEKYPIAIFVLVAKINTHDILNKLVSGIQAVLRGELKIGVSYFQ